jgi:hypothetical protein
MRIGSPIAASVFAALLLRPAAPARSRPRVLPPPLELREREGRFLWPDTISIGLVGPREEDAFAAEVLRGEFAAWGRPGVGVVRGRGATNAAIELGAAPGRRDLGDEGYELSVTPSRIVVRASKAAGVFHGVQTLRQLIEGDGAPCVEVWDRPSLAWRGVLEDLSRGPVPTLATLEQRIEMLAELKVNLYAIYLENVVAYPAHPLVTRREGALSLADLQHLGEHARKHHVALVPVQQTLGHMGGWLAHEKYRPLASEPGGQTLAPESASTEAFLAPLLRELAQHTPGPFVHIGADEAAITGAEGPPGAARVPGGARSVHDPAARRARGRGQAHCRVGRRPARRRRATRLAAEGCRGCLVEVRAGGRLWAADRAVSPLQSGVYRLPRRVELATGVPRRCVRAHQHPAFHPAGTCRGRDRPDHVHMG